MAGIYIHIPFCKTACHYCNFHFSTSVKQKDELIAALVKEIELTEVTDINIATIYFGGGTPSHLHTDDLKKIFNAIHSKFIIETNAEITLEANPDDITEGKPGEWKQTGINRLSIGIQSFNDTELQWMNRAHNSAEALASIDLARVAGFDNFSVDLIYGSPLQTDEILKENLKILIDKKIPHISCYALTVEPKTALAALIDKKLKQPTDATIQAKQNLMLMETLQNAGYGHYEISNFALTGMRSRHNSSYWQGKPYYGFGPSAHSFNGINIRKWNIANNAAYIKSLQTAVIPFEEEVLTDIELINEKIMTAIRTSEGLNMGSINEQYGEKHRETILQNIQKALGKYGERKINFNSQILTLTNEGKLFADGIAADLFL